ncbi:MAG: phosphate-selective porin O and P [Ectothiorhodospiraceae bacterium]|nr:phosphate-selective porin O and P [Ectothiorhodospiraceae bacterium]
MKQALKKVALAVACAGGMAATIQVEAANWLMLQGTEPSSAAGRAKVWGFLQPTYTSMKGSEVAAGPWAGNEAQFNQLPPNLSSSKGFEIRRARIGVRGQGFPLDPKVNYFFLAEFGNNGITSTGGGNGQARMDHASVTLNHIPGARVRVGLFKVPISEEMLQAIHVFDYINFTNFGFQQLLERFFDADGAKVGPAFNGPNVPNGPIGAVRDQGIQVFDTFNTGGWDTSYAVMLGNGNGINRQDNNDSLDKYIYLSTEKVYAGKGPRVQSLKLFAWSQTGEREIFLNTTSVMETFDRKRSGIGATYRKGKIRAAAEILRADGMIFAGTDGGAVVGSVAGGPPAPVVGQIAGFNVQTEEKADAYYVHFGYAVTRSLELDIRHDVMNRGTEVSSNERKFTTTTLGAQWFFNLKNRLAINYEIRSAEAPNLPSTDNANLILDEMDNRLSLQITSIF